MSEILQEIIPSVITVLITGGVGSIFYFRLNKKLKESEVKSAELDNKSKEISNLASIDSEWEKISNKLTEEKESLSNKVENLENKIEKLNRSKEHAWEEYSASRIECARKDRLISELNWYRCEINGCPYRKPPRKYGDSDFPENAVVNTDDTNDMEDEN